MTKRKTDGERIAAQIDRLLRKRMSEAWEEGWFARDCQESDWNENPYSPDAVCLAHSPQLSAALADVDRLTRERDEARAEVERLHKALHKIAGKVPFADDPWTIARKALEAKP